MFDVVSVSDPPASAPRPVPAKAWLPLSGVALASAAAAVAGLSGVVDPRVLAALVVLGSAAVLSGPAFWVASLPALLVPPEIAHVFLYEAVLVVLFAITVLSMLRDAGSARARLDRVEIAVVLYFAWAAFTGLWCQDLWWYAFNVRKLAIGVIALWTAWRLGAWIGIGDMMFGICVGALALASATLLRTLSVGLPPPGHRVMRSAMTSLGWGDTNFISALLVLMAPSVLRVALRDPRPLARLMGWATLPLIALVITVSGSRGGALLILLLSALFVLGARVRRHQLWLAIPIMLFLLLVGPGASILIARFTNPNEFSSVLIRVHYAQIGWKRLVDHLPWGMGLGQGFHYRDELYGGDPHNHFLGVGSELGVPGLILWGTIVALIWKRITPFTRDARAGFDGTALRFTLIVSQINALFEPTFLGLQYQFLFYWIVGGGLGALGTVAGSIPDETARFPVSAPSLQVR
jgi:hypothetical protein